MPGVGYKVFTHWGEIPDLWDLSCFLVDHYAGGGVSIWLCFSLLYLLQHRPFCLCWYNRADRLVFRSFSREVVSHVAVDFLCLWEVESLKSFFVSISDCPVHCCVLDNFPLLWVQQCIKIWFYPEYTYFEMRNWGQRGRKKDFLPRTRLYWVVMGNAAPSYGLQSVKCFFGQAPGSDERVCFPDSQY